MGTPIGTGSDVERHPALKLRNVGDYADVQVIDVRKVGRTVYGSQGTPMLDANGKQRQQLVIETLYVSGSGAVDDNGADRPAVADEHVTILAAGRDWWDSDGDKARTGDVGRSFSGAEDHAGGVQCGDLLRWRFEAEIPGAGSQPRKVRTFQIRRPAGLDEAYEMRAQRCEELRAAGSSQTHTPVGVGAGAGEEDPF
ncbi:MAG: hypothetical protein WKF58_04880 [Ilumatobacteraceae bacterium]